jgi:spermidine/putrescine transport system substrate-binding protein
MGVSWRRTGPIIAALALMPMLVSACGSQAPATTEAPAMTEASQPTEAMTAAMTEAATEAAAPTEAATNAPFTGSITVLEWSGYEITENPDFAKPFTDKYGDKVGDMVSYNFFADDAEAYSKLQSGVEADLTHPCLSWSKVYVDNDLLQPIDTSRLTNWKGILPAFVKQATVNGKVYFVPWDWGYESILVRSDLVKQMPDSWASLWDPQYKGHVVLWDNGEANYVMASRAFGIDPYNATPDQQNMVKEKLKELVPNLLTYWTDFTEVPQLLSSGDAWMVANTWQDAYQTAQSDGLQVDYIQPKEKRLGWVCGYAIPKGVTGARLDRVYELLDALIAPESMAALATTYTYGFSNQDALPLVDPSIVKLMQLDQASTLEDRTFFYRPMSDELRKQVTDIWSEVKTK